MPAQTRICLYGSLRRFAARGEEIEFLQEDFLPVADLLRQAGVPAERVQLAMVNHRAAALDHSVRPGDRVALFPLEYMVFADWLDFRFGRE
jgi:molybdopterin converting factor small subunit